MKGEGYRKVVVVVGFHFEDKDCKYGAGKWRKRRRGAADGLMFSH